VSESPTLPIDHVAVPSNDVAASVKWYVDNAGATVLYQDKTWAFMQCGTVKLAIVTPAQHPPHVAFEVTPEQLDDAARAAGKSIDRHRDGTTGIYIADPFGNAVELICYPKDQTLYKK
jgi:catechol 2,3-dioxygenase-like lactoylglutathione lyase family enzyme